MVNLRAVHEAIAAQNLPLASVRMVDADTCELVFPEEATPEQRQAAQTILDTWQDPVKPDWDKFLDGISAATLTKISASPVAPLLISRIARLADNPSIWQGESDRFFTLWNSQPPNLTANERNGLNTLAATNSIPVRINSSNLLTLA